MEDFWRPKTREELNIPEENKRELELSFDNFSQPAYKEDLFALAQLIHNLLFIVPGTYPDTPEMGMNIKQYQFEFLSDQQTSKIQEDMEWQIKTYLPTTQIAQVIAKLFVDPITQANNLGLGFAIATNPSDTPQNFYIFFNQEKNTGIIKSQFIF